MSESIYEWAAKAFGASPNVRLHLPAYIQEGDTSCYDGKEARLMSSYDTGDLLVEVEGKSYLVSRCELVR